MIWEGFFLIRGFCLYRLGVVQWRLKDLVAGSYRCVYYCGLDIRSVGERRFVARTLQVPRYFLVDYIRVDKEQSACCNEKLGIWQVIAVYCPKKPLFEGCRIRRINNRSSRYLLISSRQSFPERDLPRSVFCADNPSFQSYCITFANRRAKLQFMPIY